MSMRFVLSRVVVAATALSLLPACGSESNSDEDTGTSSSSEGTGESGTTTGDGDGDGDTTTDTSTSTTDTGETTGGPTDLPDGASCAEDMECASGQCFQVPILGGLCGECTDDSDCPDGGCSIPNPLASTGSKCNMGELGGGCETDDVCDAGLTCELVLDVAGIITANTCSTCGADTDCTDGTDTLCTINYDVSNFTGSRTCVAPGAVPDGEGCDLAGSGDMACESGLCAEVDIMGLAQLGVCGVCAEDADCAQGETCQTTDVDITTGDVTPAACVPAP